MIRIITVAISILFGINSFGQENQCVLKRIVIHNDSILSINSISEKDFAYLSKEYGSEIYGKVGDYFNIPLKCDWNMMVSTYIVYVCFLNDRVYTKVNAGLDLRVDRYFQLISLQCGSVLDETFSGRWWADKGEKLPFDTVQYLHGAPR